jgi:hypothetical protein
MKKLCLFLSITLCIIVQSANGQVYENDIIYKTWVISYDKSPRIKGYLRGLKDSSIVINRINYPEMNKSRIELSIESIEALKFRKEDRILKISAYGILTGFTTGIIIGLSSGDDPQGGLMSLSAGEKAVISGVALGFMGGIVGGIIGSFKIKIPINGNQKTYEIKKKKLSTYKY